MFSINTPLFLKAIAYVSSELSIEIFWTIISSQSVTWPVILKARLFRANYRRLMKTNRFKKIKISIFFCSCQIQYSNIHPYLFFYEWIEMSKKVLTRFVTFLFLNWKFNWNLIIFCHQFYKFQPKNFYLKMKLLFNAKINNIWKKNNVFFKKLKRFLYSNVV